MAGFVWLSDLQPVACSQSSQRPVHGCLGRRTRAGSPELRDDPPPVRHQNHLPRLHLSQVPAESGFQLADPDGDHASM